MSESTPKLSAEAKRLIRYYMLKICIPSISVLAILLTILGGVLGFLIKDTARAQAYSNAYAQAYAQVIKEIAGASAAVAVAKADAARASNDATKSAREAEKIRKKLEGTEGLVDAIKMAGGEIDAISEKVATHSEIKKMISTRAITVAIENAGSLKVRNLTVSRLYVVGEDGQLIISAEMDSRSGTPVVHAPAGIKLDVRPPQERQKATPVGITPSGWLTRGTTE